MGKSPQAGGSQQSRVSWNRAKDLPRRKANAEEPGVRFPVVFPQHAEKVDDAGNNLAVKANGRIPVTGLEHGVQCDELWNHPVTGMLDSVMHEVAEARR